MAEDLIQPQREIWLRAEVLVGERRAESERSARRHANEIAAAEDRAAKERAKLEEMVKADQARAEFYLRPADPPTNPEERAQAIEAGGAFLPSEVVDGVANGAPH